jgi:hypothetical protein
VGRSERARRDVVQGGALAQSHSKYPTLNWIFSIFPNRTAPRLDYQTYSPHYPLQSLRRL